VYIYTLNTVLNLHFLFTDICKFTYIIVNLYPFEYLGRGGGSLLKNIQSSTNAIRFLKSPGSSTNEADLLSTGCGKLTSFLYGYIHIKKEIMNIFI
jgi:hypothetical protein